MNRPWDRIHIEDLEVHFHVGVPEEERARPQRLLVTVDLDLDFGPAARADDVEKTINYFEVSQRLLRFGDGQSWKLIERLAVDLAETLIREFKPEAAMVEVKKFVLPESRWVSVCVVRQRQP